MVGPEAPLAAGIVDAFRAAGSRSSGPRARPRSSKARRTSPRRSWRGTALPTAAYRDVHRCARGARLRRAARRADRRQGRRPRGRQGRGRRADARRSRRRDRRDARRQRDGQRRRARGDRGVSRRRGGELHRDGRRPPRAAARLVAGSQAAAATAIRGPNTGGMGAYSPAPVVTPALHARIMREVIMPAVNGMAADGMPYTGFLYAGVMIDARRHIRRCSSSTAAWATRKRSRSWCGSSPISSTSSSTRSTARSTRSKRSGIAGPRSASCSRPRAIPDAPAQGRRDRRPRSRHARRRIRTSTCFTRAPRCRTASVVVSGGRVLCVTALGDSVRQAQRAAYAAVAEIHFDGMQYRTRHRPSRGRAAQADSSDQPSRWTSTRSAR